MVKKWFLFFLLIINITLANPGDTWQVRQPCPVEYRYCVTACLVGKDRDSIWALVGNVALGVIQRYKVSINSWVATLDLPAGYRRLKYPAMAWDSVYENRGRVHLVYLRPPEHTTPQHIAYRRDNDTWITLALPAVQAKSLNDMIYVRFRDTSYLFLIRKGKNTLYRYRIATNTWEVWGTPLQRKFKEGASLCWNGDSFIYVFAGDDYGSWTGKEFYRYNIRTGSWQRLQDCPSRVDCGGLAYCKKTNGDEIYAIVKKNNYLFYRYKVATNSWESRRSTPQDIRKGAALVWTPGDTIYAFRGGFYERDFWRYIPSASDGGNFKEPFSKYDQDFNYSEVSNPSFSNDGEWVIYSKFDTITGYYQIYKIRPDGSEETRITSDASDYTEPKWAPDSNLIVCIIDDKLGLINPDGTLKQILDSDKFCMHPSWSYDGKWITYIKWTLNNQHHRVYKIRRDGSQRICLSDASTNFYPQFSFNNNFIVYQKDVGFHSKIFRVPAQGGSEEQLTFNEVDNATPQWSPNSNEIVYVSQDENGFYQIYKMNLETGEETQLTYGGFDRLQPRFSPSGEHIVYIKSHPDSVGSQICRISKNGGEEIPLTDFSAIKKDPEWSPAGNLIVYVEQESEDSKGNRIKVIPAFPTGLEENFDFVISDIRLFPNPFTKTLSFSFYSPLLAKSKELDKLTLKVYDIKGNMVRILKASSLGSRIYFFWNGKDNERKELPSGIYFLHLQIGKRKIIKSATFIK